MPLFLSESVFELVLKILNQCRRRRSRRRRSRRRRSRRRHPFCIIWLIQKKRM